MRNRGNKQKINNKMVDLSPNLSVVTVNVSSLNIPLKDRDQQGEQTHGSTIHCPQETHFKHSDNI